MSIQSYKSLVSEYRRKIQQSIAPLQAAVDHCGVGALTPEQVETNLRQIRRLESRACELVQMTECSSFDEYLLLKKN